MWPDCLLGVVPQPTDSRLRETNICITLCFYNVAARVWYTCCPLWCATVTVCILQFVTLPLSDANRRQIAYRKHDSAAQAKNVTWVI